MHYLQFFLVFRIKTNTRYFLVGSILMAVISLISSYLNTPKKVALPLMKAKIHSDEEENQKDSV